MTLICTTLSGGGDAANIVGGQSMRAKRDSPAELPAVGRGQLDKRRRSDEPVKVSFFHLMKAQSTRLGRLLVADLSRAQSDEVGQK